MAKEQLNNIYYDIEALRDIFSLCTHCEITNCVTVYYLIDTSIVSEQGFDAKQKRIVSDMIYKKNKNFRGKIKFRNLQNETSNVELAMLFGCFAPGYVPDKYNFPFVSDLDKDYDNTIHPYLLGYNSLNYDLTMLSLYFGEVFCNRNSFGIDQNAISNQTDLCINGEFVPTNPAAMRVYNDELFHVNFKQQMPDRLKYTYEHNPAKQRNWTIPPINGRYFSGGGWTPENPAFYIRKNQAMSGRHIDVARLNEKQFRVALKRLLGMLGRQILEPDIDMSDRNENVKKMTFKDIANLLAYNVSDVVNLKSLFYDRNYIAAFQLKRQMLLDYPETVYDQLEEDVMVPINTWNPSTRQYEMKPTKQRKKIYAPDCRPEKVRKYRLTINSSSAQFAAACLCPYGKLNDADVVSFIYPCAEKAKELGIPQVNVLDETVTFIETKLKPRVHDAEGLEILNSLYKMVDMYRNIEGKDFNESHDSNETHNLKRFSDKINVPYMDADGHATSCYVTFSVGGIHGAEYNKTAYDEDMQDFHEKMKLFQDIVDKYETASNLFIEIDANGKTKKRKTFELNGEHYNVSDYIKSTTTLKKALDDEAEFKRFYLDAKPPALFKLDSSTDKMKLNEKYAKTSFGLSNHEDFESYYPFLLVNMGAFWNPGLNYDRYSEIAQNKKKYGKLMVDEQLPKAQRSMYKTMRNGTKLILNAASGAADVAYDVSIRMNNQITAMRIIGQLFTWRIGQAQSLEGAIVPSSNTDGLYTFLEESLNNTILERESKEIHVNIEPELVYIVSKDANNRWEGHLKSHTGNSLVDIDIYNASGGTLACMGGPDTTKSLAHPAILDWSLAEFLKWKALQGKLDRFNFEVGKLLIDTIAPTVFVHLDENGKPIVNEDGTVTTDRFWLLKMFQNVLASNPNKGTYIFATKEPVTPANVCSIEPIKMQHYSRVFYVDPEKVPDAYKDQIVYLTTAVIDSAKNRKTMDASPLAIKVIKDLNGHADILAEGVAKLKKVSGVEQTTACIICNEDLAYTDAIQFEWLDYDYYCKKLKDVYLNWQNDDKGELPLDGDENDDESETTTD